MDEIMNRTAWKVAGKSILLLLAGIFTGTLLLTLAYMLPVNSKNRDAFHEMVYEEEWYPRATIAGGGYFESFYPDVMDNSTDMIMLDMAMDTSGGNPLVRAMYSFSEYGGSYPRYWHGYVSILRPLSLFFDYSEIRIINCICQLLLLIWVALTIRREKDFRYVLMLVTSYILLSPVALSFTLQFSWVFYIAYCGTLVILQKRDFFSTRFRHVYFFIVMGMLTSYFDFLTYPLFTWGVPLMWWLVTDKSHKKTFQWVGQVVGSGVSWLVGYVVMWSAKWCLSTIILGYNVVEEAIDQAYLRSGVWEAEIHELMDRFNAVYSNWKHYGYKIYAVVLVGWLLWWFYRSVKNGWRTNSKSLAYFLTGFSSVAWYLVMSEHTLLHHFFTYRIFGVSVLAFLALILDSAADTQERIVLTGKKRLLMCCVWGAAAVLSLPLSLFVKEKGVVMNGGGDLEAVRLDNILEAEFKPTFDVIKGFGIGLECADLSGEGYTLSLWDGDVLKYQTTSQMTNNHDYNYDNYQYRNVSWMLDRNKTYRLTVEVADMNEPVYLWVTEAPLIEYGALSVDGTVVNRQPLTGIHYFDRAFVGKETLLFVAITWVGILVSAAYTLWSLQSCQKNFCA